MALGLPAEPQEAAIQAARLVSGLPVIEVGPIIREQERIIRDKSYRRFPVGQEAARYLRALRYGDGSKNTVLAYEMVYARLAVRFSDFQGLEDFCSPVGTEYLEEFLAVNWGDSAPATRRRNLHAVRSLFQWAVDTHRIPWNPAAAIKAPKGKGKARLAYPRTSLQQLVSRQDSLRDQCALQLYVRLALRKMDLGYLRVRDIDLTRDVIVLRHGKGGEEALLPILYPDLQQDLYLHIQGEGRKPEEYLLYPKGHRDRPMDPSSVHRWFKRCLAKAGLPASVKLHELRHSAGDEIWRATGNIVLAQQLLRHKSLETTRLYLHPSPEDLRAGMRRVDEAWKDDE